MKKLLISACFGLALAAASASAQDYVRIGPPPLVVEHRPPPPSPQHIWIVGHHRWDGTRYVWTGGYWAVPPRAHAHWVPGHWIKTPRGWFWREGGWRG